MRVRCKSCQSVVERDRLEGLSYDPGSLMPDSLHAQCAVLWIALK